MIIVLSKLWVSYQFTPTQWMAMDIFLIAVGLGLVWHGVQIIWVAPIPSQLQRDRAAGPSDEQDAATRFQIFWLDQYAWMGICLAVTGCLLIAWGMW